MEEIKILYGEMMMMMTKVNKNSIAIKSAFFNIKFNKWI